MTYTDIVTEARRITKSNSTSYTADEVAASVNRALDRATSIIRESEGRWQWDDANNTDFPFATASLVSGQQDYALDVSHLRIERVEIKDQNGKWTKLAPFDQSDIYNQSITDFMSEDGLPKYYDVTSESIFLYPAPNYSQAASLKVFYQRGPSYFTTSDTTKVPGFNSLYHRLLALWAAYDYAFINQLPIAGTIRQEISIMEDDLKGAYVLREKDDKIALKTRLINYR